MLRTYQPKKRQRSKAVSYTHLDVYKRQGYYVLVKFTSAPAFPAELDRVMKITDGVMRSLITAQGA